MKKVLGLAVLATFFSNPAFAGQVFVFNQWTLKQERTEAETNVDYTIRSNRREEHHSSSNTTHIEGNAVHRGASELRSTFSEDNTTRVWGTINTITNSYSSIHESSAGIR